jgi:hypothetical protein
MCHGEGATVNSNRWLVVIGGTIIALMLVSVITVVTGSSRRATTYASDTPEGAVERYVQAVLDGDFGAARAYFMPSLAGRCNVERYRWDLDSTSGSSTSWRVSITDAKELTSGQTRVALRVTRVTVTPPFGVDEYSRDATFHLQQRDGHWLMTSATWPHACP